MDELLSLGAAELARRIQTGEVSTLEVTEAHIARIEAVNPAINALVTPRFEQALKDARRATERQARRRGELPPLHGVPITVKDALAVEALRFTAGTTLHKDRVAQADAEAVRRLRAAGAIILGKTNCPDMSSSVETNNPVFGLTRNPWNLNHSAGGSSGGEGALIAAGGSPLGLGSDIAGSIRIPTAFCGACGLKPTGGRISTVGHEPEAPPPIATWNTVGPLARRVEDLALALSLLSDTPVRDYAQINLEGRRVVLPTLFREPPLKPEIAAALAAAADALREAGMQVVEDVAFPKYRLSFEIAAVMVRVWAPEIRRDLGGELPIRYLPELVANLRGKVRVSSNTLVLLLATWLLGRLAQLAGFGRHERLGELREQVLNAMGRGALILWPVYASTAPRHGFSWGRYGMPIYTPAFNALGFPAVALPVRWSEAGLPCGVQVVAGPGEDEVAIAAAAALERAFGGWRMAPATTSPSPT